MKSILRLRFVQTCAFLALLLFGAVAPPLLAGCAPTAAEQGADASVPVIDLGAGFVDDAGEHRLGASNVPFPAPGPGTQGYPLTSNGQGQTPTWQPATGGGGDGGPITLSGDVTGASNANTVGKVNGATVPASGALTTGNVLQVSGAAALTYAPVNLAGGSNYVTGTLPAGNLPNLAGDVTGAVNANTVGKIQGNTVTSGALTKGQFLVASSTSNWAATTLSGDVVESAVTPGSLEVTQLLSNALPSLASGCLEWTGTAWAFTACSGGSSVTWANDLSGSSNTHQYVASISGSAGGGGTVTVTATPLDFSQASTVQTTVGALTVDSAAALDLGTANATSVVIGNTTHTAGVGINVETGNAFSATIGTHVALSFSGASTDFECFDGASCATSGYLRVPTGAQTWINSAGSSSIGADSSNDILMSPSSGSTLFGQGTNNTQLLALSTSTGLVVGWQGSASTGSNTQINAQSSTGAGQNGGSVTINSGGAASSATPGNVNLNVTNPSGSTHGTVTLEEGLVTYANWTDVLGTYNTLAATSATTPVGIYVYPQGPNASASALSTNTPGSFNVVVTAPGTSGTAGTQAGIKVWQGSTLYAQLGPLIQNNNYGALYLGNGISPTSSNWTIISDGSANTYFNGPSGGEVAMAVGSTPAPFAVGSSGIQGNAGQSLAAGMAASPTTISVATSFALTASQYAIPIVRLTGTVNGGTGTCTITLPNQQGAFWIFDLSNVTFSSGTLLWTTGSGTTFSMTSSSLLAGAKGVLLYLPVANVVALAM